MFKKSNREPKRRKSCTIFIKYSSKVGKDKVSNYKLGKIDERNGRKKVTNINLSESDLKVINRIFDKVDDKTKITKEK